LSKTETKYLLLGNHAKMLPDACIHLGLYIHHWTNDKVAV